MTIVPSGPFQVSVVEGGYLPVVPGVFTYGSNQRAGRGGTIYRVRNLNDSGTGSLRAALEATEPRIVIFETSGVVHLVDDINITEGFLTVAGQTAPPPGVMVRGGGLVFRGVSNVLVQHMRLRVGDDGGDPPQGDRDSIRFGHGSCADVLVDHCSLSWGIDETASIWGWGTNTTERASFTNCICAEGLAGNDLSTTTTPLTYRRSVGMIIGGESESVDPVQVGIVGCLFAHNPDRNPLVSSAVIVNNVMYNWWYNCVFIRGATPSGGSDGNSLASVVGNYFKAGQQTNLTDHPHPIKVRYQLSTGSAIYVSGNEASWKTSTDQWNDLVNVGSGSSVSQVRVTSPPEWPDGLAAIDVADVPASVYTHAGAWPANRDATDARIVADALNGTGRTKSHVGGNGIYDQVPGGWPSLAVNQINHVLPTNPHAFNPSTGYTNIEDWLHGFSASIEP